VKEKNRIFPERSERKKHFFQLEIFLKYSVESTFKKNNTFYYLPSEKHILKEYNFLIEKRK